MSDVPRDPRARPEAKPWARKNPVSKAARKPLTAAQKTAARQRADEAGRRYPNLVDNMWAAAHVAPGTLPPDVDGAG